MSKTIKITQILILVIGILAISWAIGGGVKVASAETEGDNCTGYYDQQICSSDKKYVLECPGATAQSWEWGIAIDCIAAQKTCIDKGPMYFGCKSCSALNECPTGYNCENGGCIEETAEEDEDKEIGDSCKTHKECYSANDTWVCAKKKRRSRRSMSHS